MTVGPITGDDESGLVECDDIRWTSDAIEPFEGVDIHTLDIEALLVYAATIQSETRTLREMLRDALATVQRQTMQGNRYRHRVEQLVTELREARAEACDLRRELRARSDGD